MLYLPFAGAGAGALTEGLRTYARHWSANEGAFAVIAHIAGDPVAARVAAGALVLAVAAWTALRRQNLEVALLWTLGAGILLSPTVHPWYVLWLLPMAALRGNPPFLLLTGLAFVGYWGLEGYRTTGVWEQPLWTRLVLWLPVWVLIAGWAALRRGGRPSKRYPDEKRAT